MRRPSLAELTPWALLVLVVGCAVWGVGKWVWDALW